MRSKSTALFAAAFSLLAAAPLYAQPATNQATHTTWFKMFLWTSDPLGLAIIWLIILLSAVSIGFMIQLMVKYRRGTIIPDDAFTRIDQMLGEKRYRAAIEFTASDPSYLAKLTNNALNEAGNGYAAMERAIEEAGDLETTRMLRPIEYLNVIGNIAPMLGLFGTVYGMIEAFWQLVEAGGRPDPGKLAAGISTALVTTFWGLIVAMPALTAYALIRNRVDALSSEGMVLAEQLISQFKPGGRRRSSTASRGSQPAQPRTDSSPEAP